LQFATLCVCDPTSPINLCPFECEARHLYSYTVWITSLEQGYVLAHCYSHQAYVFHQPLTSYRKILFIAYSMRVICKLYIDLLGVSMLTAVNDGFIELEWWYSFNDLQQSPDKSEAASKTYASITIAQPTTSLGVTIDNKLRVQQSSQQCFQDSSLSR